MKNSILFLQAIPKEYRPLLKLISPNAFRVVDWKKALTESRTLSQRILQGRGADALKDKMRPILPRRVNFRCGDDEGEVDFQKGKQFGQSVLELYFSQLYSKEGMFLDLRSESFVNHPNNSVCWEPGGFWVELNDTFRRGMVMVYTGYYQGRPELLDEGLRKVGLYKKDMTPEYREELLGLLLDHIGSNTHQHKFSMEEFTKSFDKLFDFLVKHQVKLGLDFLYLGIYLASLYSTLGGLNEPLDVQRAFLNSSLRLDTEDRVS